MMKQSIEAWIYHPEDREILLLKVENEKVSFWQPITGGIESGESPEEACLREIKEETGLLLACQNLFLVLTEQKEIQISDEHVGAQWVALDKVSSQLYWPSNQATFEIIKEKL